MSAAQPHHGSLAKHLFGATISHKPHLYPYILAHNPRTDIQKRLLNEIELSSDPSMSGAPDEAAFLAWLCRLMNAKKVLEVGVYLGYTTLTIAQVLPDDGKIIGLDLNENWTKIAELYWAEAKVNGKVDIRIGPATESMEKLIESKEAETFDLVFIDADKVNYQIYYEKALTLLKKGGVVAIDNVLWAGEVMEPAEKQSESGKAIHALNTKILHDSRVEQCMLGIADGITLCRKK